MYRIKIFCTFSTSKNCKETYEKINYSNLIDFYGKDNKVYFTDDDDYTHAIIINTIMPELTIPKENVIGLAFEPLAFLDLTDKFIDYAVKNIGKYYKGSAAWEIKHIDSQLETELPAKFDFIFI